MSEDNDFSFREEDLLYEHWRGKSSGEGTLRFTHVPSGISVSRTTDGGMSVRQIREELLHELRSKIREANTDGNT